VRVRARGCVCVHRCAHRAARLCALACASGCVVGRVKVWLFCMCTSAAGARARACVGLDTAGPQPMEIGVTGCKCERDPG
jgi:hypothetical protein